MPKWEKSLTIGILFFGFSLTLFNLSSSDWVIRAAAVGFFVLSTLFLIRVLLDVVADVVGLIHQKSAGTAAQASGVRKLRNGGAYVWKALWPLMRSFSN